MKKHGMNDDSGASGIQAQAIDWLMRLQEEPDNAELLKAFHAWLQQEPAHQDAWDKARQTWALLGELPPAAGPAAKPARRLQKKRHWMPLAAAALLLLALLPIWVQQTLVDFSTGSGQLAQWTLEDGSSLYLGAQSRADVTFSENGRHVQLRQGEAFFDVRPDEKRPFTVQAGQLLVTVRGTAFDLRVADKHYSVSVREGAVTVDYPGAAKGSSSYRLTPGQQLLLDRQTGKVRVLPIAVQDVAAWIEGRLFLQDVSLADALGILQRYQPGYLFMPDTQLAARRVTGSYDLNRPDHARQALLDTHQARLHRMTPWLQWVTPR